MSIFSEDLDEIIFLMRKYILMVPDVKTGKVRPASCCKRQDCYDVLFKIQQLLGTDRFKLDDNGHFVDYSKYMDN